MVKVTCYGTTETMSRKNAIAKYKEAMSWSEGSERERYATILLGLLNGRNEVSDED